MEMQEIGKELVPLPISRHFQPYGKAPLTFIDLHETRNAHMEVFDLRVVEGGIGSDVNNRHGTSSDEL